MPGVPVTQVQERDRHIFKATTEKCDGTACVVLSGEVDSATAPHLETHLDGVLKSGEKHIIADFSKLVFISSAGLRVFLSYAKKVQKAGGRIILASMDQSVRNVFESVGFASIFPIHTTREEALKALKTPGGDPK